jgi:transcriptional regulator with XRE-family HTH domain
MDEATKLIDWIKAELKRQGKTYADVAKELKLSEANVKRMFAVKRLSLERLVELTNCLGLSITEVVQEASLGVTRVHGLNLQQEQELVTDPKLLLVAVCSLNHWTAQEIGGVYALSETELIQRLVKLDRLGVIDLLPGSRIRLKTARDFDWLPNGPIHKYFRKFGQQSFLDSAFSAGSETFQFSHGMLTDAAMDKLKSEMRKLKERFAELHQESLSSPLHKRRGVGILLASREWELEVFSELRRKH